MRKHAWIAVFVFIVAILIISPLITGIYFERNYNKMLTFYNSSQQVHLEMNNYKRGWLSSDATISIEVINPQLTETLEKMGVSAKDIPKKYILDQHIQHGPIIYRHLEGLPSIFGFAAVHNTLRLSQEVNNFFGMLGVNANLLQLGNDLITFNGNYFKHFKITSLNTLYPKSDIRIKLNELEGNIWIRPFPQRFFGHINFYGVRVEEQQDSISIPSVKLQFDQKDGLQHFWVGNQSLQIPEITWRESGKETLSILGIHFNGFAEETTGMLKSNRRIDINTMRMDNNLLGPLHVQLSVNKLNVKAISDLINAYQQILQRGELYQSQLQRKMYAMLPAIIIPGSTIKLDLLDINMPEGRFKMDGELIWELNNTSLPDDLSELVQAADARINLRISKDLMGKWIDFASNFSLFNQAGPEMRNAYREARIEMYYIMQQNNLMVIQLVQDQLLSEKAALHLMTLQKKMVSVEEYNKEIQILLLGKSIKLWTSYYLSYLYAEMQGPLMTFTALMKQNQKATQQGMRGQLAEWLKAGYIKQEKNDYVVSILQGKSGVKINEKMLGN